MRSERGGDIITEPEDQSRFTEPEARIEAHGNHHEPCARGRRYQGKHESRTPRFSRAPQEKVFIMRSEKGGEISPNPKTD